MKKLWNVVAVMAVFNLLAIGTTFAWLKATDRLSKERLIAVRESFVRSVAQEQSEKQAAEAEKKRQESEADLARRSSLAPKTAAEKIAEQQFREDQQLQVVLRQQQELDNLRRSLMDQLAKLEDREKKLEAEKRAFAEERRRIAETEGTKQFQVALATLEGQKAKDAKQMLRALLEQRETTQVVDYLARMEEGKRSKIMAEFVKDDPALAADLLERLRTRGVVAPASGPLTQVSAYEPSSAPASPAGVPASLDGPGRAAGAR